MANEKRMIDTNVFECVCVNGKSDDFCNGVLYVLDMIDAQPTVDAVEVVRCKDCKHCKIYRNRHDPKIIRLLCEIEDEYASGVKEDDFCSYGERRTDDAEN